MNREQPVVVRRRQTRAEVQRLVSEFFSSGMRQSEFCSGRGFSLSTLAGHLKKRRCKMRLFCHKSNNLRPSRLAMSLRFKACPTYPQSCSEAARRAIGADPPSTRQVSAKLCFTLRVGCHMIVKLVASSPAYFPNGNGKVGIMDSDLSHLQPDLKHNWVGYAVGVAAVVAILPKQQAAAC